MSRHAVALVVGRLPTAGSSSAIASNISSFGGTAARDAKPIPKPFISIIIIIGIFALAVIAGVRVDIRVSVRIGTNAGT
jgi:hypothetical protein